jgi:hypothetical protein
MSGGKGRRKNQKVEKIDCWKVEKIDTLTKRGRKEVIV